MSFATFCVCLELRSLPSPELPGFRGTTNLSATPQRPACPSRSVRLNPVISDLTTFWGFPCCARFPCVRAAASTPVQRLGVVFAHLTQPYQPSPKLQSGRSAHRPFRGLLGVHSRCGRYRHLYVTSHTESFSHFVTSMTAPVASGWSVRRWDLHPLASAAFARRMQIAAIGEMTWQPGQSTPKAFTSRPDFVAFARRTR